MATVLKHKKRSSREHRSNNIPVGMFARHASEVASARFFMNLRKQKAAEVSTEE